MQPGGLGNGASWACSGPECQHGSLEIPMPKTEKSREDRITREIVVDAYGEGEISLSWYYYLEERLAFPFKANCVGHREISPLKPGEEVEVFGMASEDECEREMFVTVRWNDSLLAVPVSQLAAVDGDAQTRQAIGDWQYWVRQGYEF